MKYSYEDIQKRAKFNKHREYLECRRNARLFILKLATHEDLEDLKMLINTREDKRGH